MLVSARLSRFLLVGLSNTIISFAVFYLLAHIIIPEDLFLSQTIAYSAGLVWSYLWNSFWTFGVGSGDNNKIKFLALQILLLLGTSFFIDGLHSWWALEISLAWLIVMSAATAINYLAQRFWVFKL